MEKAIERGLFSSCCLYLNVGFPQLTSHALTLLSTVHPLFSFPPLFLCPLSGLPFIHPLNITISGRHSLTLRIGYLCEESELNQNFVLGVSLDQWGEMQFRTQRVNLHSHFSFMPA